MESVDLDLNFPEGPYPQDPPCRLSIAEYEALMLWSLEFSQNSHKARVEEGYPENKYGNWEPFVYHED